MNSYIQCDSAVIRSYANAKLDSIATARTSRILAECDAFAEKVHGRLWNFFFDPYMKLTGQMIYDHVFDIKPLSFKVYGLDDLKSSLYMEHCFSYKRQENTCYQLLKLAECAPIVNITGSDLEAIGLWPSYAKYKDTP